MCAGVKEGGREAGGGMFAGVSEGDRGRKGGSGVCVRGPKREV